MKYTAMRTFMLMAICASSIGALAQQTTKEVKEVKALKPIVVEGYPINTTGVRTVTGYRLDSDNEGFSNLKDVKSKEVSQEISTSKSPEIIIDNTTRNIQVKIWDQSKVKVTTTVYFEGEGKLSDEEWFEKLNLSLKTMGTAVRIKSGTISGGSYTFNGNNFGWSGSGSSVAVFNDKGENIGSKSNTKRIVTIYVPAGSKLDIDSKYADVQMTGEFGNATVDISNGNLEADSFAKLYLRSKYSNVTMENATIAEIEFMNGRFTARNLGEADLDTKYSTIEIASAKKTVFRSTNDEYEIDIAEELRGRKNYGNLRISKLNGSLEMDGTNADVKIRSVGSELSLIKIDNKYADIRLPIRNIKNYSINFDGVYSTVYGNFEKEPFKEEPKKPLLKEDKMDDLAKKLVEVNRSITRYSTYTGDNDSRFTAKVGDGKGLNITMKCQNCTVDFK